MEDKIERENLIKSLYASASRVARLEWISAVVKTTASLSMVELVDACDVVDKSPDWPQKLGAAIYKVAIDKRNQTAGQKHEQVKGEDMFARYTGARLRYFTLLKKSAILCKRKFSVSYSQYWEMVNPNWSAAKDESALERVMGFAEKTFYEIIGGVKIAEPLSMEECNV